MYVLEDLWNGKFSPSERRFRNDSRYAELMHLTTDDQDVFWKDLTPEGKKAFNTYYQRQMEMANIAEEDSFVRGVRFGAGLILDVVSDYRSQLPLMTEEAAG